MGFDVRLDPTMYAVLHEEFKVWGAEHFGREFIVIKNENELFVG